MAKAKPVATVEVGKFDHGPYSFWLTPHGAVAIPDGTVLLFTESQVRELLKQERERCANVCNRLEYGNGTAKDCRYAIRALPDDLEVAP